MEAEADMPRFHYGSHYSSAGAVLFWLLRLEPYTSYSIELQSGRFDHADRLFFSLQEAWASCTTSLAGERFGSRRVFTHTPPNASNASLPTPILRQPRLTHLPLPTPTLRARAPHSHPHKF